MSDGKETRPAVRPHFFENQYSNGMKLWKLSQTVNNEYDTYDSMVVAAETEELARRMNPDRYRVWALVDGVETWAFKNIEGEMMAIDYFHSWAPHIDQIKVEYLGDAAPGIQAGVIVASFNAG